jgi:hypothetical protein
MYWFATDMGASGDNPGLVAEVLRGLARRSDGPELLMRVLNHELRPSQLFTVRRAVWALTRAGAAQPRRIPRLAGELTTIAGQEMTRMRLRRSSRDLDGLGAEVAVEPAAVADFEASVPGQ